MSEEVPPELDPDLDNADLSTLTPDELPELPAEPDVGDLLPDGSVLLDDVLPVTSAKLSVCKTLLNLLVSPYSFNDFIREILIAIMDVVRSEAGSFLELDPQRSALFFRAVVGQGSDQLSSFTIPVGQGVVGYVVESGQPISIANPRENPLSIKSIQKALPFEPKNMVAIPVFIRGKVFGVVELLNRLGDESYTPADVQLLTDLCEVSAKAIETRLMLNWVKRREVNAA